MTEPASQPRRLLIELGPDSDASLQAITAQTGKNETTVINQALEVYAAVRGMTDDEGRIWLVSPERRRWWHLSHRGTAVEVTLPDAARKARP